VWHPLVKLAASLFERRPLYALHVGLDREVAVNLSTELLPIDEKFELGGDLPGGQGPAASRCQTHPAPVEDGRSERLSQVRLLPTGRERHLVGAVSSRKGRIAAATRSGF
jgi:hypothetical protein